MCDIAARRTDIWPAAAPIDFTWLNLGKAPRIFLNTHAQAPSESSTNVKWGDDLMGGTAQGISNGGGGRGRAASAVKMPCSHVTLEVLFPLLYLDNMSRQHHRIWAYNGEGKFCSGAVFKAINCKITIPSLTYIRSTKPLPFPSSSKTWLFTPPTLKHV